jgi:hypothetical protein
MYVLSYEDYRAHLCKELGCLSSAQLALFAADLVQRVFDDYGQALQEDLSPSILQSLGSVRGELMGALSAPVLLNVSAANRLQDELRKLIPADDAADIELSSDAVEVLACLESGIEFCRTPSVEAALRIADHMFNCLDWHFEGGCDRNSMFIHPPMQAELQKQLRFIRSIS